MIHSCASGTAMHDNKDGLDTMKPNSDPLKIARRPNFESRPAILINRPTGVVHAFTP